MARLVLVLSSALLASCVHTNGLDPNPANSAASIDYNLAKTEAKIDVDLTLVNCGTTAFTATPKVSIVHAAATDADHKYSILGRDIQSFTQDANLTLKLHAHGAIASVNGGVSDKTGAIIGNILKFVATLPFGPPSETAGDPSPCNADTRAAYERRLAIKNQIVALRSQQVGASPSDVEKIKKAITAYAEEIARLNAKQLRIKLSREIELDYADRDTPQFVVWKGTAFKHWTGSQSNDSYPHFKIAVDTSKIVQGEGGGESVSCPGSEKDCKKTLVFREPAVVEVVATVDSKGFVDENGNDLAQHKKLAKKTIPVSQWGAFSYIVLDASFGENKSFALGLDPYGRKSSFTWKSNARAESITGSLAAIGKEAVGVIDKIDGQTDIEEAKEQIDKLDTQLKLNKLRRCEDIINAGGFVCPEK